jgi:hypothetical protein
VLAASTREDTHTTRTQVAVGRFATLDAVVAHYDDLKLRLTEQQKRELVEIPQVALIRLSFV